MNMNSALIAGLGLVLVALFSNPSTSNQTATFQIAAQQNTGNVWVVNTFTGDLRLCQPAASWLDVSDCGPWGTKEAED